MCGVVLYGIGKPGVRTKIYLGGVLFAVATITPLAYLYGINGAAAGFLATVALIAVLSAFFAKRLAGIKLGSPAFLRIVLANAVMTVLLLGLPLCHERSARPSHRWGRHPRVHGISPLV